MVSLSRNAIYAPLPAESVLRRLILFGDCPRFERCNRIALPGRPRVPIDGHSQVLRHAVAFLVQARENVLSPDVAAIGGFAIPVRSSRIVLRRAAPEKVLDGRAYLRVGVALFGCTLELHRSFGQ